MKSPTPLPNSLQGVKRWAYFAESVRPYVTVCCGFSLRHCQYRRLIYGTVGTEGYFTALLVPMATLRHYRYRRLLYGTVGTEGYFTALSVPMATLRHCRYRWLLYGTVGTDGYFTALSVSKATLRHCRYRRLFYGTVGTRSYSVSIISMFHFGNVSLVFDGICYY